VLEFTYNAETPNYECQVHTTHLYLSAPKPSARFSLLERYLLNFACCDSHVYRDSSLDALTDDPMMHLVLFMDMMSIEEIQSVIKHFIHAKIFIIPSMASSYSPSDFPADNVIYLNEEISWSTVSNRLEIDDHQITKKSEDPQSMIFEGIRILVAEDNEVNQLYIQELLNKLHIKHDLAHDGYEAVKKFMQGHYDLVLMDINMPNMDGITATQQILLYESEIDAIHTPIIGLSADSVVNNIKHYLTQGLDGYLLKPMSKSDLTTLLSSYFDAHTITQEISIPQIHSTDQNDKSLSSFIASKIELPNEIVLKLFEKFISNAENILIQINENSDNATALKIPIHSLKGISRNLYLEILGNVCEAFEKDLLTLTPDKKVQRLKELREETLKTIEQMKSELP
jgi:CheY-like chemotaxis protein